MIKIINLSKTFRIKVKTRSKLKDLFFPKYKEFLALNNINLQIKEGELFALLGPNGAGKTTLIKIICGLIEPTSGKVFVNGKSVEEEKSNIGLMLGTKMIYKRITGYDNLKYFAKLYGINDYNERIKQLADFLGIGDWINQLVETYSTGMLSKLALARAMIHNPKILVLDEPTLGLDPIISMEVREKIKNSGKTIILCTHYLEEAEKLADRIGILNKGKLVKVGSNKEMKSFIDKENAGLYDSLAYFIKKEK